VSAIDSGRHTCSPHDVSPDMDVGWIHPWVGLGWVGFIYAHGNVLVNLTIYIYLSLSTADPTTINVGLLNLFT